jgi:hypothetical protein
MVVVVSAAGGTRTLTGLLPHGSEPCVSANFTTAACEPNACSTLPFAFCGNVPIGDRCEAV